MSAPPPLRPQPPGWRAAPEDFRVDEVLAYAPLGSGGHTFVRVEKRERTTEEVAGDLGRAAGVARREIGYAGRKDRLSISTQWLSVPGLDPERALALAIPGCRVLEAVPHPHKLRTGHVAANRFRVVVRGIDADRAAAASVRAGVLARVGMPNRFGSQRFGRDGDNAERGRALLEGRLRVRDRRASRFLVSALQAAVFNFTLSRRALPLDRLEAGDLAIRHASGGLFRVDDPEREAPRAVAFEISATGPIFGRRAPEPGGAVAARERAALEAFGLGDPTRLRPPPGLRLRGGRRPLRVRPAGLVADAEGALLRLAFELPSGSYATVLVEELLGRSGPSSDDTASAPRVL